MDASIYTTIADQAAFELLNNRFIDVLNASKLGFWKKTIEYDSDTELLNFTQQIERNLMEKDDEDVNASDNE